MKGITSGAIPFTLALLIRSAAARPTNSIANLHRTTRLRQDIIPQQRRRRSPFATAIALRGGVRKAVVADAVEEEGDEDEPKKEGIVAKAGGALRMLPLATRSYLCLVLACSAVDAIISGKVETGEVFSMNWKRTFLGLELWRPFTAAGYLGPLSMHWATNIFFLINYGKHLEAENGTAEQLVFLLTAFLVCSLVGGMIGFPFISTSMISACIYVSSRVNPLQNVPFQFGLTIQAWLLPFCLAGVDTLQAQKIQAAYPHFLGIFAGHFYHFFRRTYPAMGGRSWIGAPNWLKRRVDEGGADNFMEEPKKDKPKRKKLSKAKASK